MVAEHENSWRKLWYDHLLSGSVSQDTLDRGRMFVERNEDLEVDVTNGQIDMLVRSGPRMVYDVTLRAPRASAEAWESFDRYIESSPSLLNIVSQGQLPVEAATFSQSQETSILADWSSFDVECTCPATSNCKHISALLYFLGDHFDYDPFELIRFLGRTRSQFHASITSATTSVEYQAELATEAWKNHDFAPPPLPEAPTGVVELASWPSDPPETKLFQADGLRLLGEDAVRRARTTLVDQSTSGLDLDMAADIARRFSDEQFSATTNHTSLSARELHDYATAWQAGGAAGVEALTKPSESIDIDDQTELRGTSGGAWFQFSNKNIDAILSISPAESPDDSALKSSKVM